MHKDQIVGVALMVVSAIVIIVYALLMFGPYIPTLSTVFTQSVSLIALQVTAFIAIAVVFGILAWIGYTLATTPPPKPIEEIEKEIEEELKKLEEELKKEQQEQKAQSK